MSLLTATTEDVNKLEEWIQPSLDNDMSRFPAMTYEEGMRDALQIVKGELTVEELLGE